jgi:hypothetical protein
MLSMIINSNQNYSSSRRLQFSYMLSIMQYLNKPNKWSLSPDSSHYCKRCTLKHYYNSHIVLILLNRQCKLWLKPDNTQNYSSSRRLQFSYMLSIMRYSNRLNMKSLMPSSTQNYSSNKHLSFSCK